MEDPWSQAEDAWLQAEEQRLLKWPRQKLIGWLQWNDGNGIWSDEDMIRNDMDPMTVEDAVEQVMKFVRENMETPEEMMGGSLDSNPGRYPKPDAFDPWLKGTPMPPRAGPKKLDIADLMRNDPDAADGLVDMLGSDADNVDIEDGPGGYLVRHPHTGEMWEYDGANGFWVEV